MIKRKTAILLILLSFVAACRLAGGDSETAVTDHEEPKNEGTGPSLSMRERHHAPIPESYADQVSPVAISSESLERGAAIYKKHCLVCHGEGGMGDGPASEALDPAPVAIAQTSQRMNDAYLFYRISEGGLIAPFNSAMPAWKDVLDEQARWDVINYIRGLGNNAEEADGHSSTYDPVEEAAAHLEMVAAGVAQGIITQADGDVFLAVHAKMDALLAADNGQLQGGAESRQSVILRQLVNEGAITQAEADLFQEVFDNLLAAGLKE